MDPDESRNDIFQTIENLRAEKLNIYQQINKNDVEGSQIEFKLRHMAMFNETEEVRSHIKEIVKAASDLHKLTGKLENLNNS